LEYLTPLTTLTIILSLFCDPIEEISKIPFLLKSATKLIYLFLKITVLCL